MTGPSVSRSGDAPMGDTKTLTEEVTMADWTIAGCPVCGWTAHASTPILRCPNDGEEVIVLDGRIRSWDKIAAAHDLVRHAIRDARRLAHA